MSLQETEEKTREEEAVWTEAEVGVMQPQVRGCLSHQKLEEVRKDSPVEPLGRA